MLLPPPTPTTLPPPTPTTLPPPTPLPPPQPLPQLPPPQPPLLMKEKEEVSSQEAMPVTTTSKATVALPDSDVVTTMRPKLLMEEDNVSSKTSAVKTVPVVSLSSVHQ